MSASAEELVMPAQGTMLGDWARVMGRDSEAHEMGYLAAGLSLLSACMGPWLRVTWGAKHQELGHVWVMSVGQSALSHRSTIMSSVRAGYALMRDEVGQSVRLGRPTRISDAGLAELLDASTVTESEDGKCEVSVPQIPPGWMLELGEVAPLLQGNDQGYQARTRELMLMVYDGYLRSDTKQTKVAEQPVCASILGNIVEEDWERTISDFRMIASGFLGRWVPVRVPVSGKRIAEPSVNGGRPEGYERIEQHMAQLARLVARGVVVENVWSRATPAARELRREWYGATHPDDRDWTQYEDEHRRPLASLWGRWQGTHIKLAALHAVSRLLHDIDRTFEIELDTPDVVWATAVIEQAWAMTRRSLPEAAGQTTQHGRVEQLVVNALRRAGTPLPLVTLADRIKTRRGEPVTRRDVKSAVETLGSLEEVRLTEVEGRRFVQLA